MVKIAVLKGDGIGVEVTNQSLKVLDSVKKSIKKGDKLFKSLSPR